MTNLQDEQLSAAELLERLVDREAADTAHMVAETYEKTEAIYAASVLLPPRVGLAASTNRQAHRAY